MLSIDDNATSDELTLASLNGEMAGLDYEPIGDHLDDNSWTIMAATRSDINVGKLLSVRTASFRARPSMRSSAPFSRRHVRVCR